MLESVSVDAWLSIVSVASLIGYYICHLDYKKDIKELKRERDSWESEHDFYKQEYKRADAMYEDARLGWANLHTGIAKGNSLKYELEKSDKAVKELELNYETN